MEKKYQELIVSLVQQHRKYKGYESILEDIVNDVYEHSKVVIDSIEDDVVLTTYLSKIINTSLITVPKRLNLLNRSSRKTLNFSNSAGDSNLDSKAEPCLAVLEKQEDLNNNLVEETLFAPALGVDSDELEVSIETELVEEIVDEKASEDVVNVSLVDKFINGTPTEQEEISVEFEQLEEVEAIDIIENDSEIDAVEESLKILPMPEEELIEQEEELEQEQIDEVPLLEEASLEVEEKQEIEVLESQEILEEQEEMLVLESCEAEGDIVGDSTSEELTDDLQSSAEDFLAVPDSDELLENDETTIDTETLIESTEENLLDDVASITNEDVVDEKVEIQEVFLPVDYFDKKYDYFEYIPQVREYNSQEVCDILVQLNNKYPEKNILKICELKYYQKKSVIEISEILDITCDKVIDALNEIINSVKD